MTAIGLVLLLLGFVVTFVDSNLNRSPAWVEKLGVFIMSIGLGLATCGALIAVWRWMP